MAGGGRGVRHRRTPTLRPCAGDSRCECDDGPGKLVEFVKGGGRRRDARPPATSRRRWNSQSHGAKAMEVKIDK